MSETFPKICFFNLWSFFHYLFDHFFVRKIQTLVLELILDNLISKDNVLDSKEILKFHSKHLKFSMGLKAAQIDLLRLRLSLFEETSGRVAI